jgi:hypothetical protein
LSGHMHTPRVTNRTQQLVQALLSQGATVWPSGTPEGVPTGFPTPITTPLREQPQEPPGRVAVHLAGLVRGVGRPEVATQSQQDRIQPADAFRDVLHPGRAPAIGAAYGPVARRSGHFLPQAADNPPENVIP